MTGQVLERENFGQLFAKLQEVGFTLIGPTVRDKTIVYEELASVEELPIGWTDQQDGGSYRIERRDDEALFGYVVGSQSWKKFLFPPQSVLFEIGKVGDALTFSEPELPEQRRAFIGVRACELAAIKIQDKVFLESEHVDRTYQHNREGIFTVAVNCAVAGGTCFCVSMETGPECTADYDLVVTEVIDDGLHEFVIEAGSEAGEDVLDGLPGRSIADEDRNRVAAIVADTTAHMGRTLDTSSVREVLYASRESTHWDDVAEICLACTNCTLVCPTCFCSTTEDVASLDGATATRSRRWDSCFSLEFSALHGSPVRSSTKARYRQWMTHKLAGWQDQFGSSGCVGCGRCITWCPVGIDITRTTAAIRADSEVLG